MVEPPVLTVPRPRGRLPLGYEVAIVVVLACALLIPGIWTYSLVDPWETHYGEVGRRMLQDHDWVHTDWQNEGFRSKPVLTFWLMAASMKALGHGNDGGYSGEMAESPTIVLAIRLPFTLMAVMGLVLMWWMLARLWSRRAAWLCFLTVGTSPFYFLIARQAITDMTLVALIIGAMSMFLLSVEDGADGIKPFVRIPLGRGRHIGVDSRWVFGAVIGGFLMAQAIYYLWYFQIYRYPLARVPFRPPQPGWWFFLAITFGLIYAVWPRFFTIWKAVKILPWLVISSGKSRIECWPRAKELGEISLFSWPLVPPLALYAWATMSQRPWSKAVELARHATRVLPLQRTGQIYMLWFWSFVGISVLGKGIPGFGLAGVCCAAYVIFTVRWRELWDGAFEIKRGIVLILITVLPWHLAMWMRDGQKFIQEWVFLHNLNRAAVGVHGDRGTFDYCLSQVGYGMFIWVALLPMALASAAMVRAPTQRAARVRFMVGTWAIVATALFSLSQTKFHHYIFPAVPAFAILIGLYLDDLLAGRTKPSFVLGMFGAGVVLLLARDMMYEEKQWIEMFIYRYDRPWPTNPPWSVDPSDAFLVMGLAGAGASIFLGLPFRRLAVFLVSITALATAMWAMHVYMPIAGTHWGMREAVRKYYEERTVYGQKVVYYTPRQFYDDWHGVKDHWDFDTFIPDAYQDGQPMAVKIEVQGVQSGGTYELRGTSRAIGDHTIRIDLDPSKVTPVRDQSRKYAKGLRGRKRATKVVDADRLIAWQLYWRGENFWSGDEIWGPLPEMKTALKETDNVAFNRYINDRTLAPEGRRYFVVTESGRTGSLRSLIPTETGRETYEVLETTSNKFSLAVWQM
jgi:4-amino-4-deoxy-L-arabinose transferase-like glycosyltransferase